MMRYAARALVPLAIASTILLAACGGEGGADLPLTDRLTAQVTGAASQPTTTPQPAPTAAPATSGPAPTAEPTLSAAALGQVNALGRLVLGADEVPEGFAVQRSQRALKSEIVASQIAIPEIALFLRNSSLVGGWGALFARSTEGGQVGLNSIVFLFGTPEDASAFVAANGDIRAEEYLSAIEVQQVQAEVIGDAARLVRYRLVDGRSLEYTWAQGRLAGQIILRYKQDTEDPDDPGTIVGLARIQSVKMAEFLR